MHTSRSAIPQTYKLLLHSKLEIFILSIKIKMFNVMEEKIMREVEIVQTKGKSVPWLAKLGKTCTKVVEPLRGGGG